MMKPQHMAVVDSTQVLELVDTWDEFCNKLRAISVLASGAANALENGEYFAALLQDLSLHAETIDGRLHSLHEGIRAAMGTENN